MRIRWRNFELPSSVILEKETQSEEYGRFAVEPFERGFGTTVGNALRRVLLSSIEGAAVTAVKIDGVLHEFSTIPGVREDVTVRVRHHHVEGVASAYLVTPDDEGNLDHLARLRLELGLEFSALAGTGCVGEYRLVRWRRNAWDAVHGAGAG